MDYKKLAAWFTVNLMEKFQQLQVAIFCTCLDSVVASVVPLLVLIGWYLLPWVDSLLPPCPAQVTLGLNPPPQVPDTQVCSHQEGYQV